MQLLKGLNPKYNDNYEFKINFYYLKFNLGE